MSCDPFGSLEDWKKRAENCSGPGEWENDRFECLALLPSATGSGRGADARVTWAKSWRGEDSRANAFPIHYSAETGRQQRKLKESQTKVEGPAMGKRTDD